MGKKANTVLATALTTGGNAKPLAEPSENSRRKDKSTFTLSPLNNATTSHVQAKQGKHETSLQSEVYTFISRWNSNPNSARDPSKLQFHSGFCPPYQYY
jgi:hypothetical protein